MTAADEQPGRIGRWNETMVKWGLRSPAVDALPKLYGDSDLEYAPVPATRGGAQ